MEFDIVPELLEKIKSDYEKNMAAVNSEEVLNKLFNSGNYEDAYDYAKKMAKALSDSYINNITTDVLPNGRMYYNIANRIFPETIRNAYLNMAVVTTNIQGNINKKAGIGIKAQTPNYNADRARGMVEKMAEAESFDDVKFMIKPPVIENITQSVVDDTIKTNAEFHYKSGLRARVERKLGGKCCDWCQRLVGKYSYPDVPEDVYRRHDNCRCTVTYYPSKTGKGQDVWSKKIVASEINERITSNYLKINLQFFAKPNDKQLNSMKQSFVKLFYDGKINKRIKTQKQDEHIEGTTKRADRIKRDTNTNRTPSSYFYSNINVEELINNSMMTGVLDFSDVNQPYPTEYVILEKNIGKVYNVGKGKYMDVSKLAIKYSGSGVHAYPVKDW